MNVLQIVLPGRGSTDFQAPSTSRGIACFQEPSTGRGIAGFQESSACILSTGKEKGIQNLAYQYENIVNFISTKAALPPCAP